MITEGSETKLSYFRSYSSGARVWSASHYPSASKVKSVASYATISLTARRSQPGLCEDVAGGWHQSVYLDVG